MDAQEARLTRIEEKLDKVSETLFELARIDERQEGFEVRINRHELRLDMIESKLDQTSDSLIRMSGKGIVIERGAWILFAAALSMMTHFL